MEERHSASLLAFAKHHAGIPDPARVAIAGIDARGFTLNVTTVDGGVHESLLAPFPRPLERAGDVLPLAMEMHATAFGSLDVRFKLHARYFTEPVVVALRDASKSPTARVVVASVAAAAIVHALFLLRCRRRC